MTVFENVKLRFAQREGVSTAEQFEKKRKLFCSNSTTEYLGSRGQDPYICHGSIRNIGALFIFSQTYSLLFQQCIIIRELNFST